MPRRTRLTKTSADKYNRSERYSMRNGKHNELAWKLLTFINGNDAVMKLTNQPAEMTVMVKFNRQGVCRVNENKIVWNRSKVRSVSA